MTWLQRHSPLDEVTDVWDRCFGVGTDQRTESMGHGFSVPPPLAVSLVVHDPRPATAGLPHRRLLPLPSRSPHSAFLSNDPRRRAPERRFPRPRGGAPVRAAVLQVCTTRRALRHFHAGCSPTRPSRLAAPAQHQHQLLPRQAGRRLTPGGRLMECRTGAWSASPTRL